MWIKVEDELPIQKFLVNVKNGKSFCNGVIYYRKKWRSVYVNNCLEEENEGYTYKILHKVTHWWKCPVTYPKIPRKDMQAFIDRAKKYKHQFQSKRMTFGPVVGL